MPDYQISEPATAWHRTDYLSRLSIAGAVAALLMAALLAQAMKAEKQPGSEGQKSSTAPDGGKLTKEMNCRSCHIIESEGGTIGPPLDGIGKHRTLADIEQRLLKKQGTKTALPAYVTSKELMSHIRLPGAQAKAISSYLSSLPETKLQWDASRHKQDGADSIPPGAHFSPRASDTKSERGKQLYFDHGCAACHSIGAGGGQIGPSLQGVGARRSRNFIESRITNGALLGPSRSGEYKKMGYRMPPSEVSKKDVDGITSFLLTIPVKQAPDRPKE